MKKKKKALRITLDKGRKQYCPFSRSKLVAVTRPGSVSNVTVQVVALFILIRVEIVVIFL